MGATGLKRKRAGNDTGENNHKPKPDRKTNVKTAAAAKPIVVSNPKKRKEPDDAGGNPTSSLFSSTTDQVDFPRGGGTVLTQFEVKEAQNEGAREAKQSLEKSTKKRKLSSSGPKTKEDQSPSNAKKEGEIRIEHLNHKRLTTGLRILCLITAIRPLHLSVALPGQLSGFIPITNVSKLFTERLEESQNQAESSDGDDEGEDEKKESGQSSSSSSDDDVSSDEDQKMSGPTFRFSKKYIPRKGPSLSSLFYVGQYLPAIVIDNSPSLDKLPPDLRRRQNTLSLREKEERRVELSLEPEKVNDGLTRAGLVKGVSLSSTVSSIEDHGYILDLCLERGQTGSSNLTSFISFIEYKKSNLPFDRLQVGQVLRAVIKTPPKDKARACEVSLIGSKGNNDILLKNPSNINSIQPLSLVQATLTSISRKKGLVVRFGGGLYQGTIESAHLPSGTAEGYQTDQNVTALVLFPALNVAHQNFALSLLPHLLKSESKQVPLEVGDIVEEARVERVEKDWGIYFKIKIPKKEGSKDNRVLHGFCHISHVSDSHVSTLGGTAGFQHDTVHRLRVIGFTPVEGLALLSARESVLERKFMKLKDLQIGQELKGKVKSILKTGILVDLQGAIDGIVWAEHYSDVRLNNPEKKFPVGKTVKCRVFQIQEARNRLVLTLKKSLVGSELPAISRIEDLHPGTQVDVTVARLLETGTLLVDLWGGLRGVLPRSHLDERDPADPSLAIGRTIRAKVLSAEVNESGRPRVAVTLLDHVQRPRPNSSRFGPIQDLKVGTQDSGVITALHNDNILLSLVASGVQALVSYSVLARVRKVDLTTLRNSLSVGDRLNDLVVTSVDTSQALALVSPGPVSSKQANSQKVTEKAVVDPSHLSMHTISVGQVLRGRVSGRTPHGIQVQISKNLRNALIPWTEISDDYDQVSKGWPQLGKVVKCVAIRVDPGANKLDLSARASRVEKVEPDGEKGTEVRDPAFDDVHALNQGQQVRGLIKTVSQSGIFVALGREVTARVQIKNLSDKYLEDWESKFQPSQVVDGRIISLQDDKVEMSLRPREKQSLSVPYTLDTLTPGQVVQGEIQRVEPYGVFIHVKKSAITGLCHKSQLSGKGSNLPASAFKVGQKVEATVTDVDTEKRKVSFSLASSSTAPFGRIPSPPSLPQPPDIESDSHEDSDQETVESNVDSEPGAPALKVGGGFSWGNWEDQAATENDEDEDEETSNDLDMFSSKHHAGPEVASHDLSISDIQRALLSSPNDAKLWIQYMSAHVAAGKLDEARKTASRALDTIDFRQTEEKFKIWIARINMEDALGSEDTFDDVFQKASQANEEKQVWVKTCEILEHRERFEKAENLFNRLVKKFGSSSKAWYLFGQFLMKRGRNNDAQEVLQRSMKTLPKRKHLKTTSKFAQGAYRQEDVERGKTLFEGIVSSFPSHLDQWSIYIDMEVKYNLVNKTNAVRALFERLLAVKKWSSKKSKFIFKKYLTFEKTHGDPKGEDVVKQKARAYVEALGDT